MGLLSAEFDFDHISSVSPYLRILRFDKTLFVENWR